MCIFYRLEGKIGYVPQQPWVFAGSLRDNILFGLNYQEEKYKNTIEACALTKV